MLIAKIKPNLGLNREVKCTHIDPHVVVHACNISLISVTEVRGRQMDKEVQRLLQVIVHVYTKCKGIRDKM